MSKYLYLLIFISSASYAGWEDSYDQVREARENYYEQVKSRPMSQESRKAAGRGLSESNLALSNELVSINRKTESQFFTPPKPGEAEPPMLDANPKLSDLGLDDQSKGEEKDEKKSIISRAGASVKEFVDSVLAPEEEAAPIDGSNIPKFIEFKSKKNTPENAPQQK